MNELVSEDIDSRFFESTNSFLKTLKPTKQNITRLQQIAGV